MLSSMLRLRRLLLLLVLNRIRQNSTHSSNANFIYSVAEVSLLLHKCKSYIILFIIITGAPFRSFVCYFPGCCCCCCWCISLIPHQKPNRETFILIFIRCINCCKQFDLADRLSCYVQMPKCQKIIRLFCIPTKSVRACNYGKRVFK